MNELQKIEKNITTIRISLLKTNVDNKLNHIQYRIYMKMLSCLYEGIVDCQRSGLVRNNSRKSIIIDVQRNLYMVETILSDFLTLNLIKEETFIIYEEILGHTFKILHEIIS